MVTGLEPCMRTIRRSVMRPAVDRLVAVNVDETDRGLMDQ